MDMLARTDRIRLAGHVGCDPRTVTAWLKDPQSVKRYLADRLQAAAKKLGIRVEDNDAPRQGG